MLQPLFLRWFLTATGFVVGFVPALLLQRAVIWTIETIFDRYIHADSIEWALVPLIGGLAGASLLPTLTPAQRARLFGTRREFGMTLVGFVAWGLLVWAYAAVFAHNV